jgi:hypothetical protein
MDLPIPKNISKHIKNQKVTTYEGYLLIDGEPDLDSMKIGSIEFPTNEEAAQNVELIESQKRILESNEDLAKE